MFTMRNEQHEKEYTEQVLNLRREILLTVKECEAGEDIVEIIGDAIAAAFRACDPELFARVLDAIKVDARLMHTILYNRRSIDL